MVICTKHKHSSVESAAQCHAKAMARRVRIRTKGASESESKVRMVKNRPPRLTKHGEIWMIVWEEDALMRY